MTVNANLFDPGPKTYAHLIDRLNRRTDLKYRDYSTALDFTLKATPSVSVEHEQDALFVAPPVVDSAQGRDALPARNALAGPSPALIFETRMAITGGAMSKTSKESAVYKQPADELYDLVDARAIDEGSWLYCPVCGMELSLIEPDSDVAWCQTCNAKVKVEALRSLGNL